MKVIHTSGKRKRAIARATLKPGKGRVMINNISLASFKPEMARLKITEPLELASEFAKDVDISVRVFGGGVMGQADAVRLAVAKALCEHAGKDKLRAMFIEYDRTLLVADVRVRESRKPNTAGNARSKVQKSYR